MKKNFAERARAIEATYGRGSGTTNKLLKQLYAEQQKFAKGGNLNMENEIKRGIQVELEHAGSLKEIEEKGKMPTAEQFARLIATDHIKDFKKEHDSGSYYKSLIENDLSDEAKKYALGGSIAPTKVSNAQLESLRQYVAGGHLMSAGTPMDATNRYATEELYADGGTIKTNMIRPVDIAGRAPTRSEVEERHGSAGLSGRKEDIDAWIRYKQSQKAPAGGNPVTPRQATPERSFAFGGTVPVNTGGIYGAGMNVYAIGDELNLSTRKPWDVLGRAGDYVGGAIGNAYEKIVPEGARENIGAATQFLGDLNRNPFTAFDPAAAAKEREYAATHPVIGGTAPIPTNIGGVASKAIPMVSRFERGAKTESAIEGVANRAYGVSKAGKVAAAEEAAIAQQAERSAKAKQLLDQRAAGRSATGTSTAESATAEAIPGATATADATASVGAKIPKNKIYMSKGVEATPEELAQIMSEKIDFSGITKWLPGRKTALVGAGIGALGYGIGALGYGRNAVRDKQRSSKSVNIEGADAISGADQWMMPGVTPANQATAAPTGTSRGVATGITNPSWKEDFRYTPSDASFTPTTAPAETDKYAELAKWANGVGALEASPTGAGSTEPPAKFDWQNAMRAAPIAFNALSGLLTKQGRGLPTNVNLQGITPQVIAPEQMSTAPVEQQIGQQYASGVNALSGTGNSAAAIRAGLSGMSLAGAQGGGAALNDIYSRNAALRGDATKFNALAAGDAAKFNAQQANMSKQINLSNLEKNQADKAATDKERYNRFAAAATGIGKVGKENWSKDMLSNVYGYNEKGEHVSGDPALKLNEAQLKLLKSSQKRLGGYLKFK